MAALTIDLIGAKMPPAHADRLGVVILLAVAGVGTAQGGSSPVLTNTVTTVTTASGQTAFTLDPLCSIGNVREVYNTSATTALIFPETGGTINGGSANASVSLAQNKGIVFRKIANLTWVAIASA